jgi:hypothetical protein
LYARVRQAREKLFEEAGNFLDYSYESATSDIRDSAQFGRKFNEKVVSLTTSEREICLYFLFEAKGKQTQDNHNISESKMDDDDESGIRTRL